MRGVHDHTRDRDPVRQVARCHGCGEDREGVTRFESKTHGQQPIGRAIHYCGACAAAITERPLDEVMLSYLDA